jgi:hypothetical protein
MKMYKQTTNFVTLVRKRTIPAKRSPLVSGVSAMKMYIKQEIPI